MNTEPIVIERTYNVPADKVWQALTDINKINQWFFQLEDFKPEVGFAFSFSGNDNGTRVVHESVIKEVIPGKKLAYSMIYKDYPQESLVTFELFDEGDKTRLVLTHSQLAEIAKGSPMYAREKFLGGWTYLAGKLDDFLNK
ncbi:SRPBCC domain-containing protein [Mucilaginibacter sp. UR6-11]|uniref:SRPBCC family protein n=1 Tax=Mucilaginibacter sp. UR6-11 TaxID=1435644 RepID=UPI001E501965|nr:SRPBCC domain-containing protein [Mucilaginibacter sp. UR6-11]MCC8424267.1 SRPBCC domain-containing protein [Mucilaginibacter sp. UR6-11]